MLREREITPSTEVITNRFRSRRLAWMAENGFDAKERWLSDHAGRQTYTMESGEGACPKVLIHGGLSEGSEWFPLAGTLGGRVVIPDRPGCGLTYKPDPRRGEFRREAVRWMETVVDSIGAPQVDLVGNSLGGYFSPSPIRIGSAAWPSSAHRPGSTDHSLCRSGCGAGP